MENTVRVNIYGDSIMRGTIIDESSRYHSTVKTLLAPLANRFCLEFKNRALFGITITKGSRLLQKDLERGSLCDYAVLEFGGNDCSFNWEAVAAQPQKTHRPFTELDTYEETCRAMVQTLQAQNIQPVLATLPPVDAQRHLEFIAKTPENKQNILQWLGDTHMIYRFHELYSNTIARVAKEMNCILVDVRRRFLSLHNLKELVCWDGIHLTQKGYALYVKAFEDFITQHRQNNQKLLFA